MSKHEVPMTATDRGYEIDLKAEPIRFNADLKVSRDERGMVSVRLNGEEMNRQILAGSVTITFPEEEPGTVYMTMQIAADDFDIDLPDAEVEVK